MSPEAKGRVVQRVTQSRALPVSRDSPGYAAVLSLLGVADSDKKNGERGSTVSGEAARAGEATDCVRRCAFGLNSSLCVLKMAKNSHRRHCVRFCPSVFRPCSVGTQFIPCLYGNIASGSGNTRRSCYLLDATFRAEGVLVQPSRYTLLGFSHKGALWSSSAVLWFV